MDPDPTPFISDFEDAKKIFVNLPVPAGTLSSVLKIFFFAKILLCKHHPLNTFMRKREGSGAGSIPLTCGSGSGRPINMRIRIPNTGLTLLKRVQKKSGVYFRFEGVAGSLF
jgi:hypothetical protein